jgi:hypothetical protein
MRRLSKINSDWKLIASNEEWMLWLRPKSSGGWHNFYLRRITDGRKRTFWLAWNGARFANGRDYGLLVTHYPIVNAWLIRVVSSCQPALTTFDNIR